MPDKQTRRAYTIHSSAKMLVKSTLEMLTSHPSLEHSPLKCIRFAATPFLEAKPDGLIQQGCSTLSLGAEPVKLIPSPAITLSSESVLVMPLYPAEVILFLESARVILIPPAATTLLSDHFPTSARTISPTPPPSARTLSSRKVML